MPAAGPGRADRVAGRGLGAGHEALAFSTRREQGERLTGAPKLQIRSV